jgi:hypothetical protein
MDTRILFESAGDFKKNVNWDVSRHSTEENIKFLSTRRLKGGWGELYNLCHNMYY